MARRQKSKLMDDGSDSDSHASDLDEPDLERVRGKKRTRDQLVEDATYGIWADDQPEPEPRRSTTGARKDYLAGQSFVAAGQSAKAPEVDNLATAKAIEPAREDEDDLAMELDSAESSAAASDVSEGEESRHDSDAEQDENDEQEDLAPIPGLDRGEQPIPSEPPNETLSSLGFAPRGLGQPSSRAGIGRARANNPAAPSRGGIGSMSMFSRATAASTEPPPSTAHGGIGSRPSSTLLDTLRQELNGNPPASPTPLAPIASTSTPPAAAAAAPPAKRSFLPSAPPTPSTTKPAAKPMSRSEHQHFSSLRSTNSIGMKLLEKMGWSAQSGVGLGKDGTGIVVPLGEGQKVRKKGQGISGGERTNASWEEEARRKGITVAQLKGEKEQQDPQALTRGDSEKKEKKEKSWTATPQGKGRAKKEKKPRTEFKTYEELVAESGGSDNLPRELLVDLSGNALPDQTLSSSIPAFGAGSADPTRLPELRHNLTLLTSTLSSNLRSLAKEGQGVIDRRKYCLSEEAKVRRGVDSQQAKLETVRKVLQLVERVREKESQAVATASRDYEIGTSDRDEMSRGLEVFKEEFDDLLGMLGQEYVEMRLDEVVVGAITPICRRVFQDWNPLENPTLCIAQFKMYRKHFLIDKQTQQTTSTAPTELEVYGNETDLVPPPRRRKQPNEGERTMTAFESFMWTVWLPKIRSAINNDWNGFEPAPAIALLTNWFPLLPRFLQDNILDQLVIPKLSKTVQTWSVSKYKLDQMPGLHTIVFPWFELLDQTRLGDVLDECKRKVRNWIKTGWKAKEGVPQGLEVWRDAFSKSDWDTLLLQNVLPALGTLLRDKLVINPRAQDLQPLESVLVWKPLLTSTMLSQLLETEFFGKWGESLWIWLKSAGVNLEQVAEWYSWWKSYFPEDVVALSGVSRGFRKGLDLMNQAMALGEDVKYRLKKPDFRPKQSSSSSRKTPSSSSSTRNKDPLSSATPTTTTGTEISFKSIVEDFCSSSNLLFLATGRTTAKGHTLYKVSKNVDGKGGVLCYLESDVVWIVSSGMGTTNGEAEPVGIEELIKRAQGSGK